VAPPPGAPRPPWQAVHERFVRWRRDGTFDRLLDRLRVRLDAEDRVDPGLRCVTAPTCGPAARPLAQGWGGPSEPADHAVGLGRGGVSTIGRDALDPAAQQRRPLGLQGIHLVTDGNGLPLAATTSAGCRRLPVDPDTRRRRNAVERAVGWLNGCRSIATRHDKLAVSFLAMLKQACLRQYLRALRPSGRT
jgi:transposase